jgi:polysaccharide biosynthesis/export protein
LATTATAGHIEPRAEAISTVVEERVAMRNKTVHTIGLGFILVASSGPLWAQVAEPPPQTGLASLVQATKKPHDASFVIGNDDLLAINVWKEPDISRSIPVRSDGRISLPLVGEVQATGRTPLQLEEDIASRLRSYIAEPEVTVMVQEIHSQKFNILGQVAKPGSYPLELATTVLDAIAAAGGFKDFANQRHVYILRQNPGGGESRIAFNYKNVIKGKNLQQNIKLEPRDTIVVP